MDDADDVLLGGSSLSSLSPDRDESDSSLVFEALRSSSPPVDEAFDDGSDVHAPPPDADPVSEGADGRSSGTSVVAADEEDDVRSLLLLSSLLSSLPSLPSAVVCAKELDAARQSDATRSAVARIRRLPLPLLTIAGWLLYQKVNESRNSRMLALQESPAALPFRWGFASAAVVSLASLSLALVYDWDPFRTPREGQPATQHRAAFSCALQRMEQMKERDWGGSFRLLVEGGGSVTTRGKLKAALARLDAATLIRVDITRARERSFLAWLSDAPRAARHTHALLASGSCCRMLSKGNVPQFRRMG